MSRLTKFLRDSLAPQVRPQPGVAPLHRAGFPVAVCWSAKAGCTTVLKWFLQHNGLLDAAIAHHPWPHQYRCEVLMAPLPRYVASCTATLRRGHVEVVKVVRDPARRAVSSFLHLVRSERHPGWDPGVRAWKQSVGLGRQPGLSFEQFLDFVADVRSSGQPLDIHFQPQWQPDWEGFVDHVIPLERLTDEFADLEDRHGLPRTDLRRLSDSAHHNPPNLRRHWPCAPARCAVTHEDLDSLGTPPVEAFLDDRTTALVRNAYAEDYEAYGHLYQTRIRAALRVAA